MNALTALTELCPKCKRVTKYWANPEYMHKCEHCGHDTTYRKLITAVDVNLLREGILQIYKRWKSFKHHNGKKLIRKVSWKQLTKIKKS